MRANPCSDRENMWGAHLRKSSGYFAISAAVRRASSLMTGLAADPIGLSCPLASAAPSCNRSDSYGGGTTALPERSIGSKGCHSRSLPLKKRVSTTTTAIGTRAVMPKEVSFSANPAHG